MSLHMRARRNERGAVAVEFALTVVLFLTLVFGMIQYAMYFWSTQSAADSAREGARRAAVGELCQTLTDRTKGSVKLVQASPALTVTRTYYDPSVTNFATATPVAAATGKTVVIVVSYNSVNLKFPFIPFINNGAVKETAIARVENFSSALATTNFASCP